MVNHYFRFKTLPLQKVHKNSSTVDLAIFITQ